MNHKDLMPELHWTGKRPYRSTQYYPAQLRETYGQERDGWINKIFWGDNLQVMSHMLKEYCGKIDLIYIDPPFDSKADYKKKVLIRGTTTVTDNSSFEEKQYGDIWSNDEYLQFMYERLILMRELLSDTGSIYLHCDWHKSAYLKIIMDDIFGNNNFLNEIIWYYRRWTAQSNSFQKMHDNILLYSKTQTYTFNPVYIDTTEGQKKKHQRGYDRNSVIIDGVRKPQLLVYDRDKVDYAIKNGDINLGEYARIVDIKETKTIAHDVWPCDTRNSFIQVELEHDGMTVSDLWEINYINSQSLERTDYPTQKPQLLLERIIKASSNPGDIVFDCFMGSGTTQAVAMKLGRRFIGADINLGAIHTTTKRLLSIAAELKPETISEPQLLMAIDDNPHDIDAEKIKYIGFEIYNMKTNIQLKRDAEAEVVRDGDKLIIRSFYPMNLMQKLSLQKEYVEDWRQLVDSVMIDWNYDGAVMHPMVIDIPPKKGMVRGIYNIPINSGNIKVKITDLRSESLEVEI